MLILPQKSHCFRIIRLDAIVMGKLAFSGSRLGNAREIWDLKIEA